MTIPKVSCILPTGYGDTFVKTAVDCFLNQDYAGELELVIVDNNDVPIGGFVHDRIKTLRSKRMPVADLRNLGTEHATGEVCISWDEDDWSAPNRVTEQVNRLLTTGKQVTGWHALLFWDCATKRGYKYSYGSPEPYACGTSRCYYRSWWAQHPFVTNEFGVEDWPFTQVARKYDQLDSCDAEQLCVARVHGRNVCSKANILTSPQWKQVERTALPESFFSALEAEKQ